ncbi:hypothetical protein [Streptomyces pristinaespiralis]|uniref:hypothetical protein n=1 Tax=Streptomyces pristinaespiralis TaxID=38300 RepID=UPI00383999A5
MSDVMRKKAQARLGDGEPSEEQVRHAVLAFRIGGARATMAAGGVAILGAAVGSGASPVPLGLPQRFVVALSTHRLLLFGVGGFFVAGPKELLVGAPFEQIAAVSEPTVVDGVARVLRVGVEFTDGGMLSWEFPRIQIANGRMLLTELRERVGG